MTKTRQVHINMEVTLLDRLDAYQRLTYRNRTQAIHVLLDEALVAVEQKEGSKK